MTGQGQPAFLDDAAVFVQFHVLANNLSQYFFFLFGANGHEIESRPGVVDSRLAAGFACGGGSGCMFYHNY